MTPGTGSASGDDDEEARRQRALSLALAYVNRRERTVSEIRAQLERKGVSDALAELAVRELIELHLVDDARFAEMFVADKRGLEEWGTQRIRRGLASRGVDRELADRALAAADAAASESAAGVEVDLDPGATPATELGRALALLRRRYPDPPRERRERDRALGMLLRKGYATELAVDALAAHARED